MTVEEFQRACVAALGPGCDTRKEELLRAVLGLNEKAGAVARVVRSEAFCHREQAPDAVALNKAIGDICYWLAIVCEATGRNLSNFVGGGTDERQP